MNKTVSVWKDVRPRQRVEILQARHCKERKDQNSIGWWHAARKSTIQKATSTSIATTATRKEIWKKIGPKAQEAVDAAESETTYLPRVVPVSRLISPILASKRLHTAGLRR